MITAHLREEIYSAEMLIFTKLHRSPAMILYDDSVLNVYNNLQSSRYRKESNSSSDYVDVSGGTLFDPTLLRAVSWTSDRDTSASSNDSNPL